MLTYLGISLLVLQSFPAVHNVSFTDRSIVTFQLSEDGYAVNIEEGSPGYVAGFPDLPILTENVPIPDGTRAIAVSVIDEQWEEIYFTGTVRPLPDPAPLIFDTPASISSPVSEVFSLNAFWPTETVLLTGTGYMRGKPFASVSISPVRYNPVTGIVEQLTSLQVNIETEPETDSIILPPVDVSYRTMLIVTDSSLQPAFDDLASWRTDEGILTEVVTMDQVISSPGRDDAEKLRNYIKSRYTDEGLDFLLLGGDTNLVPFRKAYAMTCEAGIASREDSLPCDMYFGDLEGDWDFNANNTFGELADSVDLYPDIYVGRAPVKNLAEAWTFVDKVKAYDSVSFSDFLQKALFLADILWYNPYTDSSVSKEYIDDSYFPDFFDITKLYHSLGNENLEATMMAMNLGTNFVNHDGHAWYDCIGVGDDYMHNSDMDALDSGGRFSAFMFSIGCWSAAYDYDAIAEHYVNNPNGGGVAYIGNSSYGWGSPGNPRFGYSDKFDQAFFKYLFENHNFRLGEILAWSKVEYIPFSFGENVYRWHQYQLNLLGDPSLRPYRRIPADPDVECPDFVCANTVFFPVFISCPGAIVEGSTVCIHDDDSNNYLVAELDASGLADFELEHPVSGNMTVTVTGPGIRRTTVMILQATGPDPVISNLVITDTTGDGHLSPGDFADIEITLMNQGTEGLSSVTLEASIVSGPGTLLQNSMAFDDMSVGSVSTGSAPLEINIPESAGTGELVVLNLEITTNEGTWNLTLPLLVYAPGLYFSTYSIDDTVSGNGNGYPEPGETFDLTANIANIGLLVADSVSVVMTEHPSWLTWNSDSAFCLSVPAGITQPFTFNASLDLSAPELAFPYLFMEIAADPFWFSEDTLRLTVGETGISEDVESGESGWTHSGTLDYWNISTDSAHSPTHSWYCGDSGTYYPNMNCGLLSPEMILAPDASLTFWAAFDVAIYGTDGLYVIIHDLGSSTADTLDFIGSGGALGAGYKYLYQDGVGSDWLPHSYDLGYLEAGTEIQVEFRFISDSDSDTGIGFYVDDIDIEGSYLGSLTSGPEENGPLPMLGLPFPNPVRSSFSVNISISSGSWTMSLFDISGRLVKELIFDAPESGLVEISTEDLSTGVYFLRVEAEESSASERIVILR